MRSPFARRRASTIAQPTPAARAPEFTRDQRKALLAGREKEVGTVEALLFRHDPIGINFGENTDEYRPEAETISYGSLTGLCDEVNWGLLDEYRAALLQGSGVEVTIAAHGLVGSSMRAFERVGRMLTELLSSHHDEDDAWRLWHAASAE